MASILVGLKYLPPATKVKTEQQLFDVFADLKKEYARLHAAFGIWKTTSSEPILDFRQFLRIATLGATSNEARAVVLTGSGDIAGLTVKDATLEYDLSLVSELTRYWDIYRDGSCNSCRNYFYHPGGGVIEGAHDCEVQKPMIWSNCPKYNALLRNSEGKPARKLDELIAEALK